ncbi:MAG: EAL domain-containing protein [Alphaproteobacteria bacterium]|nr:EAL domain-containing protein [Alphaproteobacteria bacterium]
MQLLVYLFILVIAGAAGATAYFGLTFTVIESALTAAVALALCLQTMERTLRWRAEKRMEKAIEDLSRLLSTDAQAGQVLSQRINSLTDLSAGPRLDVLEADLSVLGTVVRQVAEAVSDLESQAAEAGPVPVAPPAHKHAAPAEPQREPEPVIPLEMLRLALDEGRLVYYMQPIITLPQRRHSGYDLVPRLKLEDGDLADAPDFMPRRGGQDVVRRIERAGIEEAVTIVRRARTNGQPALLFVPISRAILAHRDSVDELVGLFDASRVVSTSLVLRMREPDWRNIMASERAAIAEFHAKGIGFALTGAQTLRLDFNELAGMGVTSIRIDAEQFANDPSALTDFHSADIAAYIERFAIDLVVENVRTEQQILSALEDGIKYAQGPHIAAAAQIRADLMVRRDVPAAQAKIG